MNCQGSPGVSQTIQPQFPRLSILCSDQVTIPDLKRCLEPSRSWTGSAILRQRVQELDTHTHRVSRQVQLCFEANSLLPQLRVNPEPNTGAAPTRDLSQTFHLLLSVAKNPLQISPGSRHLRHGSFHSPSPSPSLSRSLSQSFCLYIEINFHHFQLLSTSISTAPEQSTFPEKCQCMQISHTEHRECWGMIPRIEVITRQHTFSFY